VLRALKHRNFRLFFFGQGVSLIGTWMQQVAMIWLVYRLTNSAFLLGLILFCTQMPSFFLAPLAGVLTDRWNLHRTIILTQSLAMVHALILVALMLTGVIAVWQIIILSVFLGLVNGLDIPARQAFLIQMIDDRDDLASAIGLNSSMFNGARLVGPAIAGFVISALGEGFCFLINAISFAGVLAALLAMRVPRPAPADPPQHVLLDLLEGVRYAFGFPPIRAILLLLCAVNFAAMPLAVLLPIFTTDVLHGGPDMLGLLTAAMGMGALFGALLLASRKSVLGLGRQIAWAGGLFGLSLIAFSFSAVAWLSLVFLTIGGFMMMLTAAAGNTILQTIVDDDKRGRVMSFYVMTFLGIAPFGSLFAGSLAGHIGAVHVVQLTGAMCIVGSLVFAQRLPKLRTHIRPIYQRIGILPDASSGITSVAECTPLDAKEPSDEINSW
jgi:MFS family permease